jgi:hypothetical protein
MPAEQLSDDMVDAVARDDAAAVAALLDGGLSVDARNERGETAFSYACANNALACAKLLFARGADINTKDAGGGSPLDWAVCWSSYEFREWLASVGGRRHDDSYEPWAWPREGGTSGCSVQAPQE